MGPPTSINGFFRLLLSRCQASNQLDAQFCSKCGLALDVGAAMELEEERRTDTIIDMLMRDPEFKE